MGIYYLLANDQRQEFIYFQKLEGNFTKYPIHPRLGMFLCWLNFTSPWQCESMRYVNDTSDENYYIITENYKDVTDEMIGRYNNYLATTYDEQDMQEHFVLNYALRSIQHNSKTVAQGDKE